MKFEVLTTQWATEEETFAGGENEVTSPSASFLKLVGAAESAGTLTVTECTDAEREKLDKSVQSQEDGEAAYAAAQESGEWHEGNLLQHQLDIESGAPVASVGGEEE